MIARQFDLWAPRYEHCRLSGWYQAQNLLALSRLRVSEGGRVLDIGCGTGWALRALMRRRPAITALGLDISPGMIATARDQAKTLPGLEFRVMDWEDDHAALHENRFDVILCISALHYFADPLTALRKMRATLADHGQLFIIERAADGSLLTQIWNAIHRWLIRDHVSFLSSRRLVALAREAGFTEAGVVSRINRLFWKNKFYTSLVMIEASIEQETIDADLS